MALDPTSAPHEPAPPWSRPWYLLLAGLFLSAAGWGVSTSGASLPGFVPLAVLFPGTALVVIGVTRQLRQESWLWPARIESSAMISVGGMAALAGYKVMHPDWVSGHIFYGALFVVALAGSFLVLLPGLVRRVVLSLLVLYHFAGMAVCVTSVDPPNGTGLYVSKQLWTWCYRPYLSFLYLTNAYHFYSPDPGPPGLFWFAIWYDDDTYTWVKLPDRDNSPIGMHYQRHLALPEHSFAPFARLPYSRAELAPLPLSGWPAQGPWEEIYHRREMGSMLHYRVKDGSRPLPIPMVLDLDATWQYREPNETSKKLLASVARRAFWTAPPARDSDGNVKPDVRVRTVKVYRITHQILTPQELAQGLSPLAKPKHWPYFVGEYDGSGRLIDDRDPFLYWYLPIVVVPHNYPHHGLFARIDVPAVRTRDAAPKDGFLLDSLEMHAAGRPKRPRAEPPIEEKK